MSRVRWGNQAGPCRKWTAREDARLREAAIRRSPSLRILARKLGRTYPAVARRASLIHARRNAVQGRFRGPAVETLRECPQCRRVFWAKGQRVYCGNECRDVAAAERFEWFLTQPDRDRAAAAEWRAVVSFA